MSLRATLERCSLVLCMFALAAAVAGQGAAGRGAADAAQDDKISVKAIAEVAVKISQGGRETLRLQPADRVVPGDEVIYTLEIRSTTAKVQPPPTVDYPIPEHMRYAADSAVGAGAVVSYSIDGGRTFARPEELFVTGEDGKKRPATAEDYTHIRWRLKHILKGNSVAFARFRAIVK
jgi:hypothetical protein